MNERISDAQRKRDKRKAEKLVVIPKCTNRRRRNRLEKNDEKWLLHYFSPDCGLDDPFSYKFVPQQKEMIAAIRNAILFGGDQSIAASRGEGKTTISERLLLKYTLQGVVSFSVLFAATAGNAADSLDAIKTAIEENVLLLEDYPEVCVPVCDLEGAPQKAKTQIVSGFRHDNGKPFKESSSNFTWCGQEIFFPRVPGSPSSRAIIATRGLESAVRGLKKKGRRPQVALIDDPDTEDTARSPEQASKLEDRIDKGIAGLGKQTKPIARVFLSTLQNRICVSYKYTDPKKKPSFKGKRFRYLVKPPKRIDLWDEYVQQWQADLQEGDEHARRAHQFYLSNRKAMDAGAEVANPNRFDGDKLPDGTQKEVSSLQGYYNLVAKLGPESVATEYDNDPPEVMGPVESLLTPHRIQRQLSGYPRRVVPPGCTVVVQGIDVKKNALHWVVRAWRPDCIGYTIDYGVEDVHGTIVGSDEGLDVAIKRSIIARWEEVLAEPYVCADGDAAAINMTLIDARYRKSAVVQACREIGPGIMAAMGYGKSAGCVQASFREKRKRTHDIKPGDGWYLTVESRKPKLYLSHNDADRWKAWEQDRWMTGEAGKITAGVPGQLLLFGQFLEDKYGRLSDDQKVHHSYAHHICAEKEVEEVIKGVLKRYWKAKGANHWLDASYMSDVAANMLGVKLLNPNGPTLKNHNPPTAPTISPPPLASSGGAAPSLRQLAGR